MCRHQIRRCRLCKSECNVSPHHHPCKSGWWEPSPGGPIRVNQDGGNPPLVDSCGCGACCMGAETGKHADFAAVCLDAMLAPGGLLWVWSLLHRGQDWEACRLWSSVSGCHVGPGGLMQVWSLLHGGRDREACRLCSSVSGHYVGFPGLPPKGTTA